MEETGLSVLYFSLLLVRHVDLFMRAAKQPS